MRWIDISLPIYPGMVVYPENPDVLMTPVVGKTSTLNKITFGSHTGTHIDAPRHVFKKGRGIEAFTLTQLIGPCRVLDCMRARESITIADLKPFRIRRGERILLKTKNSRRGFARFHNDFVALGGDAAEYLVGRGVTLVGIDALSIKRRGVTDHRPHTVLLRNSVVIVEGLNLHRVRPGTYLFIGLPLRFDGLDGAPARVILGT